MKHRVIQVADGFWNIRGSFKIGGILDVRTHVSLIERSNGKFIFLDAYTLSDAVDQQVRELTDDGEKVEAILNLHPFHTVHVQPMHERFPKARLYGTARHLSRFPDLPWESLRTEDPELHAMFAEDLDFSIPRGVDFISDNEKVHFSSVLALHRESGTIHVDDTLIYARLPGVVRMFGKTDLMRFHPTLAKALERRSGAAQDFRQWAEELAERWRDARNLCAAHTAVLLEEKNQGATIHARMLGALDQVASTLRKAEARYG